MAPGAHNPVNIDARIAELVRKRVDDNPNRYCFAEAQVRNIQNHVQASF